MKSTVIIAIVVTSMACAIESRSPRTTSRIPKPREEQRPCKGKKCSIYTAETYGNDYDFEAMQQILSRMASIVCLQKQSDQIICSGSLITDRWIITAAHCFYKNMIRLDVQRDCKVLLGKDELEFLESTSLTRDISGYFEHEKYDDTFIENGYDIALIKVDNSKKPTISYISLPFGRPDLPFNKSCFATGWGDTKYAAKSKKLMQLPMTVMNETFCGSILPRDRMFCSTSWGPKKDFCNGDFGGPLACKESDGKWYLRGVISYAMSHCMVSAYLTKVVFFEEWIMNIVNHN